jgi:hypothetical protein
VSWYVLVEDTITHPTHHVQATVVMSLLLLFSVPWLRIKCYEVFLVLHIVLSAVVLIGCFL